MGKTKKSFLTTLSVNTNNNYIINSNGVLSYVKKPYFSKEQFVISNFDIKNTINSNISINKNIPEEDLEDAIITKAYDELGLDQAIEYEIKYIETFTKIDEENRTFHLFIVEPSVISESYKTIQNQIKYIDVMIPSPLLLKALYTKNILDDNNIDCFIYFQNNDAFISIYSDGNFVYTKSLKYSFTQMHERFCELYGERVDYNDFMDFFQNHNLKNTKSDFKEYFIKLYREIFTNISDILTYIKRAYNLEKIDHIYLGYEIDTVMELNEILEYQIDIKTTKFDFDYGFEKNNNYIDQMHYLMFLYEQIEDDEKYLCNFSIFHRPPKFIQRQSGKIIILTIVSTILAFAYPATYWTLTYLGSLQYNHLNNEYLKIHNTKIVREINIKNKKIEKEKALKLLNEEKEKYIDKKNTLIKIHDVKINYPMKAKLLSQLTKSLNKFNVKINFLKYDEEDNIKKFHLNLVSKRDKDITALIQYLTQKYIGVFDFSIEEIYYDNINKIYISKLKVVIL